MEFLKHVYQKKPKVQQFVCRDDLNKKEAAASVKVKKKVHFESKANDDCSNLKNSAVQVKILMSKEEAAQLLSKCRTGGVLQFDDVPNLLLHIPTHASSSAHKKAI